MTKDRRLDGAIIAGGLGTRMQGQDKGLLKHQETVFAERIGHILRPWIHQLIINCNRNAETYQQLGDIVVCDEQKLIDHKLKVPYEGPLAGILSVLEVSNADYVLFSPCDTPNLPVSFPQRMLTELDNSGREQGVVIASDGERWHPLHLLLPVSLKSELRVYLASGERKVMRWLQQYDPTLCSFEENKNGFFNVNSPEDLSALPSA